MCEERRTATIDLGDFSQSRVIREKTAQIFNKASGVMSQVDQGKIHFQYQKAPNGTKTVKLKGDFENLYGQAQEYMKFLMKNMGELEPGSAGRLEDKRANKLGEVIATFQAILEGEEPHQIYELI